MITKEQLKNKKRCIDAKFNKLYSALEDVWQYAREKGYVGLMDAADQAQHQFVGGTSIMDIKGDLSLLIDDMYEIIEANEKVKDLPKLIDLQMAFDQIQADVKRWEKRLYSDE